MSQSEEYLKSIIRNVPDFPVKGVVFRDITTLLAEPKAFELIIDQFYERAVELEIDKIVGIESRGFIFGSVLAYKLGCGFVPVRKPGKLPYETIKVGYSLEYGTDAVEIHVDALNEKDRVMVVDDLIATGGTLRATCDIVEKCGAKVSLVALVIELSFLKGHEKFRDYEYLSLVKYDSE